MIPVQPQPEPEGFEDAVRKPGQRTIAEVVGLPGLTPRRGRPRKHRAVSLKTLRSQMFTEHWTACLEDLRQAYGSICAYLAVFIPPDSSTPTVDHFHSRSACVEAARRCRKPETAARALQPIYEWRNYCLSSLPMNSHKGDSEDVLDPFEILPGWFRINFSDGSVHPGVGLAPDVTEKVQQTISRLRLSSGHCCQRRVGDFELYRSRDVSLRYLQTISPFVAAELRRQGLLHPEDVEE